MSWVDDTRAAWVAWLAATPPPTDDQATRALSLALATVEAWLDRPLEQMERTEDQAPTLGVIWLRAWPVESVAAITVPNGQALDLDHIVIDKRTGRVALWGCRGLTTTTYTGGYAVMPPDLELALWMVAAELYPSTLSAAGAAASDDVRRVTSPDVGTVEYAPSTAGAAAAGELLGGAVPQAATLLQRYRAESVVGGA